MIQYPKLSRKQKAKLKARINKLKSVRPCPEFPFFGARYPDATCIAGQLYNLDSCDENGNLYSMMGDYHPCPFCNTEGFIQEQRDNEYNIHSVVKWAENIAARY